MQLIHQWLRVPRPQIHDLHQVPEIGADKYLCTRVDQEWTPFYRKCVHFPVEGQSTSARINNMNWPTMGFQYPTLKRSGRF